MTIKERLKVLIEGACISALSQGKLPENLPVTIEKPRKPNHGDFACGVALSAGNVQFAMSIANDIVDNLKDVPKDVCTIRAEAPGFINFSLGPLWLCQSLCEVLRQSESFSPSAFPGGIDCERQASKKDSTFYIQYTHAKLSAYLRLALERHINTQSGQFEGAIVPAEQWLDMLNSYGQHPCLFKPFFNKQESLFAEQKALVLHLDAYQERLSLPAKDNACIADYAYELALMLDRVPEIFRLITLEDVTKSRLGLIVVCKRVLAHALGIIGLAAPETI